MNKNFGFTAVEILVALGIIISVLAVVLPSINTFRGRQSVDTTTSEIVLLIEKAQNQTLNSLASSQYSVRIESGRAVLFAGTTFTEGAVGNEIITYQSRVQVATSGGTSFNGGGNTLTFQRLTGNTNNYGTITVSLVSNASVNKIITVLQTGSVSTN